MRDNDVSAHAQNVAKAKYEFLFGLEEKKPSGMGKCYLLLLCAKKKKKKKSLKPLKKFCRSCSFNDPMRAHSVCCTALHKYQTLGSHWFGSRKLQWIPVLYPTFLSGSCGPP